MRFPKVQRIILLGGAPLLARSAGALRDDGLEVIVFTSPRHAEDIVTADGQTLSSVLTRLAVPCTVSNDINTETGLMEAVTPQTIGIGMGEAWSFGQPLIDLFEGRLLDFMGIPLPRYRGGAHYSWMILAGERRMACNLQVINADMVQGEFDSGALVFSHEYAIPPTARIPQDYFDAAVVEEVAFIRDFIALAGKGHQFSLTQPDETQSLYFPRLRTDVHGWIDWRWSSAEIERFICAFDRPYAGASTTLDGRTVRLHDARLVGGEAFHPFQAGLIVRVMGDGRVAVATPAGILEVQQLTDVEGNRVSDAGHGQRFITPPARLDEALATRVTYGTAGTKS